MRDPMDNPIEPAPSRSDRGSDRNARGWRRDRRGRPFWRRRRASDQAHGALPEVQVLQDLAAVGDDADAAAVILARFATLQVVIQSLNGMAAGAALADLRLLAVDYLAPGPAFRPGEREALTRAFELAGAEPHPALADALLAVGAAAEAWGHRVGRDTCYQIAYDLAELKGWDQAREAAARGLESCRG